MLISLLILNSMLVVEAATCYGSFPPGNNCGYISNACNTAIQCTPNGWQECTSNGTNQPCIPGGALCSPGCQGTLWSTALATCGVLGITDDATCNNTFVSNGGAGGVYTYQQCYWSSGKCQQQTSNFCPYDKDTYGSCPATGSGNVCWPEDSCNVCAECCKSYLTDQSSCDGCVEQNCQVTPVCWPADQCNVCPQCCQSYLTDPSACSGCFETDCNTQLDEADSPSFLASFKEKLFWD